MDANTSTQSPAEDQAGDLAVLHPDVTFEVAGRVLVAREYRFIDGMRARAKAKPLIDDLQAMLDSGQVLDAVNEDYVDLLARHESLVRELMEISIVGADRDWIDHLSDEDGAVLLLNWWGVCGRFFVRIVVRRLSERMLARAAKPAGSTSSSAPQAPAAQKSPTSAAATPSAN